MNLKSEHQIYVVARLEDNDWAVLERADGKTFNLPTFWLPPNAKDGDVIVVEKMPTLEDLDDEPTTTLDIYVDHEETNSKK